MQFYPADWLQDTQGLSLEAQGAWIKILCSLHIASPRGRQTSATSWWKRFLGYPEDDRGLLLIAELYSVADIDARDEDENTCSLADSVEITIVSRRMMRDEVKRIQEVERKRRFDDANPTRRRRITDAKPTPIYHTSEVRDQSIKKDHSSYKNTQSAASLDLSIPSERKNGRQSMGRSMNLIPELKEQTDRLYQSDPVKFKRIAAWVAQGRKHKYLETDMAAALREFWDYRMVEDWYPYLDSILEKVVTDRNRDTSFREHERRRAEEARPLQGPAGTLISSLADSLNAKKADPHAKKG